MLQGRHKDLYINPDNPFESCKLNRKQNAVILTQVVQKYRDGFVLAINNPWGAGKTTFVQMWRQHLENEHFRTVYFNAWENDLGNAIFPALLSELESIDRTQKDGEVQHDPTFADVLDKAAPIAKSMMPAMAKILFERFAGKGAWTDLAEAFGEGAGEVLENSIKEYKEQKEGLTAFKESLTEFVKTYTSIGKPVIFIIDELDRCRPDYAVSVLEHIKHLFSIPNVVFVLSIDKVQLCHAIRGAYGSENFDSNEYLRRFIDLEYRLPEPDYISFAAYLFDYFGLKERNPNESSDYDYFGKDEFVDCFSRLMQSVNATLRQQEKIFARMKVIESASVHRQHYFQMVSFIICFIEEFYHDIYVDIRIRKLGINDFITKLGDIIFQNRFNNSASNYHVHTVAILLVSYHPYSGKNHQSNDVINNLFNRYPELSKIKINNDLIKKLPALMSVYVQLNNRDKLWSNLINWNNLSGQFSK
jgi:Cdc6-like AAA superfamily ATPase